MRWAVLVIAFELLFNSLALAKPLIVGHRGSPTKAPENTVSSFDQAWEDGADGIEIDIRLTKDNRIACIHDARTIRVGDKDIAVRQSTLEELQEVEIPFGRKSESIPSLEAILRDLPESGLVYLDIKGTVEIVDPLLQALDASEVEKSRLRLISFESSIIEKIEKQESEYATYLLIALRKKALSRENDNTAEMIRKHLANIGADGASINYYKFVDKQFIETIKKDGHECHAWTINSSIVARRLAKHGIDSITTDKPAKIKRALK